MLTEAWNFPKSFTFLLLKLQRASAKHNNTNLVLYRMSHKIINPSTSVAPANAAGSTGYDYTIGPQQTLPNTSAQSVASTLAGTRSVYHESLHPGAHGSHVSVAAYAFLFQEMVSQARNASKTVSEIELRLHRHGYHIGLRLLELLKFRSSVTPGSGRSFFHKAGGPAAATAGDAASGAGNASGAVGASGASSLGNAQDESLASNITTMKRRDLRLLEVLQFVHGPVWRYLFDRASDDLVKSSERENEYMIIDNTPSITRFISSTNVQCDFFVCGIIEGVLDLASFPCTVTAHSVPEDKFNRRVVFVIRFDQEVLEREALRF
ncbi:TRAPP subunit TRS31 [Lachancea thermotolerans CBS 6340]|uniref:KLTH0G05456p n=1 Tax=Lachancea thermotolerans (strain ATCC 56472 / CBS 6340 / NRRL Y-8284) TaxID=559295 RepID=C5DM27_LACTC|nr:KLTH0G05456p [Lachancea thermotolerans CBS 6340]CAR24838.1 KLTH0G05456p [Lachancea thermotolerans CBS 6340]